MSRTALEDLKREVESKKAAVAEREADLERVRAEAEEHVAKKVARAELALERARTELSEYTRDLARTLGLPDPGLAREARARRRRVSELAESGRTAAGIAADLGVAEDVVEDDLAKIRRKVAPSSPPAARSGPPADVEVGKKGWKSAMILRLTLAGRSVDEVAESMSTTKQAVQTALWDLRRRGLLPPRGSGTPAPAGPEPPLDVTCPVPTRKDRDAGSGEDGGDDEQDDPGDGEHHPEGSSTQELREEVARQQGGDRSVWARLPSTDQRGHRHVVEVDRMGDGATLPDDGSGHRHSVVKFVVGRVADHVHELLARRG